MNTNQTGITLLELMIVVAVVSILAAIAYPSYQDQVIKSHRSEGKAALMQVAQRLERCYTRANDFTNTANGCPTFPITTEHGRYQVVHNGTLTANTFTLSAVPQGAQMKDTRCGTLTFDDIGTKGESGTGTLADCW